MNLKEAKKVAKQIFEFDEKMQKLAGEVYFIELPNFRVGEEIKKIR